MVSTVLPAKSNLHLSFLLQAPWLWGGGKERFPPTAQMLNLPEQFLSNSTPPWYSPYARSLEGGGKKWKTHRCNLYDTLKVVNKYFIMNHHMDKKHKIRDFFFFFFFYKISCHFWLWCLRTRVKLSNIYCKLLMCFVQSSIKTMESKKGAQVERSVKWLENSCWFDLVK